MRSPAPPFVLGQRSGRNLYLMDGVAITNEHFNNLVIAPSIDAIEEFSVEKTPPAHKIRANFNSHSSFCSSPRLAFQVLAY